MTSCHQALTKETSTGAGWQAKMSGPYRPADRCVLTKVLIRYRRWAIMSFSIKEANFRKSNLFIHLNLKFFCLYEVLKNSTAVAILSMADMVCLECMQKLWRAWAVLGLCGMLECKLWSFIAAEHGRYGSMQDCGVCKAEYLVHLVG